MLLPLSLNATGFIGKNADPEALEPWTATYLQSCVPLRTRFHVVPAPPDDERFTLVAKAEPSILNLPLIVWVEPC